ncbi:histidine phosphatase family protein [Primorskyibacter sp. S187A]|uniref:histidine phosphatase family protein n=1 Tax=Primorskyibacter sp. S187A TaxID=3415130 RepID=UPI003C7A312D
MTQITLIRHGQANSHADNAADYDRLSPLGEQQAKWLGAHMQAQSQDFDIVVTGDMHRQRGTARAMGHLETETDPRLDEFDYFALAQAGEREHGLPFSDGPESFARTAPKLMKLWQEGKIEGAAETFAAFDGRVQDALQDLQARGGRILAVTSGGVISMALRHTLSLEAHALAKVMLQIRNASIHQLQHIHGSFFLSGYNATPHLDAPDRAHARTFY